MPRKEDGLQGVIIRTSNIRKYCSLTPVFPRNYRSTLAVYLNEEHGLENKRGARKPPP